MTKTINILFVDDNVISILYYKELMNNDAIATNDSIVCYYAESSMLALEYFEKGIVIHILVQDILRPVLTGIAFTKLLYKRHYSPIIYYISGYTDKGNISKMFNEGKGSCYHSKLSRPDTILTVMIHLVGIVDLALEHWENRNFYNQIRNVPSDELRIDYLLPYFNQLVLQEKISL